MRDETSPEAQGDRIIAGAVLAIVICASVIAVFLCVPSRSVASQPSTPPTKCRSLPTGVVGYGLSLHAVDHDLYLCFQQGGAQGMTEITCTPMKDCR